MFISNFVTVRLMRGNYRSNGMLEVYHKTKGWSTVCASGFTEKEAGRYSCIVENGCKKPWLHSKGQFFCQQNS